ncbi:cupin domain-containing protein [Streptomyces sp. NPDC004244]|uniref:cupin domain-containing protein n=1 Tax=Streptomyces sp. NPDC101206 TaxID=3366128 RepID=UPI003804AD5F
MGPVAYPETGGMNSEQQERDDHPGHPAGEGRLAKSDRLPGAGCCTAGMTNRTRCTVVRTGHYAGVQGGRFGTGISAQSAGAEGLCLHRLVMPAGSRGRPHLHEGHESAIYVQSGEVEVWHGQDLAEHLVLRAGDYLHIPADTPHLPVNTGTEDMVCLVARTDPNEQEGVRLLELPRQLERLLGAMPVGAG